MATLAQQNFTSQPLHYRLPDGSSVENHNVPEYTSLPESFKSVILHNFDQEDEILPVNHKVLAIQ